MEINTNLLPFVHDLLGGVDLIAIQAIQECDTHNCRLDTGMVGQGGKDGALHLDVNHTIVPQLFQVGHLVVLTELAEGSVQSALTLVEIVCAQSLANDGVIGIVSTG